MWVRKGKGEGVRPSEFPKKKRRNVMEKGRAAMRGASKMGRERKSNETSKREIQKEMPRGEASSIRSDNPKILRLGGRAEGKHNPKHLDR